ncbi:DUF2752 domain-containing protein [Clostridium weizhouense]|uniref:DUF2752 domain-containing protein n=1 Tax=Clostridium weizhouense TaxID=2859781 RepID=A0ABS7ALC9_9CLOT|nr:DUF2752 domain-containing protein [Clostridium weizhouense]
MDTFKIYFKNFFIMILIGIIVILISKYTNKPTCIFYNYIGIPCPTCGITRAFKYLIKGDLNKAFYFHPLFPLVLLFPMFCTKYSKKFIYILSAIFISVWIIRLYLLFPNTPPMNINNDSILFKILSLFK